MVLIISISKSNYHCHRQVLGFFRWETRGFGQLGIFLVWEIVGGNNTVYWAVCHPCFRHPGTFLGVAPSVICLQILQSHHRYGARCDGKGLRRLLRNLPVLIPLSSRTSGSAPVCTLGKLLDVSSAPAREASSQAFLTLIPLLELIPVGNFLSPNGRM